MKDIFKLTNIYEFCTSKRFTTIKSMLISTDYGKVLGLTMLSILTQKMIVISTPTRFEPSTTMASISILILATLLTLHHNELLSSSKQVPLQQAQNLLLLTRKPFSSLLTLRKYFDQKSIRLDKRQQNKDVILLQSSSLAHSLLSLGIRKRKLDRNMKSSRSMLRRLVD